MLKRRDMSRTLAKTLRRFKRRGERNHVGSRAKNYLQL